jgi:ABC-type sugar transport system ATPase subunit
VAAITIEGLSKTYPNGHVAIRHLDLHIEDGEFLVLVGPSGCGKSTLLRLIAGLETPTAGRIVIGDADVTAQPPQRRDLAMVFQSYALYPHMSVRDNLAYGLRVRRTDAATIAKQVASAAQALDIEDLDRRPAQLSGGQRQRVALGRAIVRKANALLLDEPLRISIRRSAQARAELRRLHRQLGITVVYVTHDQKKR